MQIDVDDLGAGGSGTNWGHTRKYSNQMAYEYDYGNGFNWLVREWPYLAADGSLMPWPGLSSSASAGPSSSSSSASPMVPATIVVVRTSESPLWFDFDGSQYVARYGVLDTLSYDPAGSQFVLTSELGNVTKFQDFSQAALPRGVFKVYAAVGGETIAVTSYSGQNIAAVERSVNGKSLDSISYTYSPGGDLQSVQLQRSMSGVMTNVRQASYAYYGAGDQNGSLGDLQTATIQTWDAAASAWVTQKVYYYRYWTAGSSSLSSDSSLSSASASSGPYQAAHLLKYVVNPAAYNRMTAAGINPLTVADATLAQYADMYFEYDSNRRVVKEAVEGGKYVYTFGFFTPAQISSSSSAQSSGSSSISSSSPAGLYNIWAMKAVETRPDGATKTVYTNQIGQVLLTQLNLGADSWIDCQQFDENDNLVLYAHPSAVAGFDEGQPDLAISLNPSAGLIETFTWFSGTLSSSSSSSSSGASGATPAGRLQAAFVQHGKNGTPILLRQYQYGVQTVGGASVYPVTAITEYRNDDGTGGVTTSYAYTFYSGTLAVQQRTTLYPVVSAAQNGSGIAATRLEYLDELGNLIWEMGPRGFIVHQAYDAASGGLVQRIDDFDTNLPNQPTPPAGWSTPAGGGLNLVTDYEVDNLGRPTQELGPAHMVDIGGAATTVRTATWTVYQDSTDSGAASEVWRAQGYATGTSPSYTYTLVNPVSITRYDEDGRVTDQISAIRSSTSGALSATDSFAQSSYCRWTTNVYDGNSGLLTATRVYFSIPTTGTGTAGTNYNETDFGYDALGRQNRTLTPGGTITRTVFDPRNLPLSAYVGTNDAGATDSDPTGGGTTGNNMVAVQINQYDGGLAGGDGNLTQQTSPVDGNAANNRVTTFQYDWRDRQTRVTAPQDFYVVNTYDTMNRVTQVDRYASATNTLIGRAQSLYDDRGRAYQEIQYAVDPNTGAVGNSLVNNTWYDASDNAIKQLPAGSSVFTKNVYDGVKRLTTRYVGYDLGASESSYASASDISDDTLLEQAEMLYDAASNLIQTTSRQRFHNATGVGALTAPGGVQPQARVSYAAMYPDAVGRQQAAANYGTNGDVALVRSATIPARADTVLVSSTLYNSRGEAYQSIDPAGAVAQVTFDDAGRQTTLVENYRPASSSSSSSSNSSSSSSSSGGGLPVSDDANRTTQWTYTADSLVATLTAVNSATGNQTTTYNYGTTLSASDIARQDLLASAVYPDSANDKVSYLYNRQGQTRQLTDQNGTVHAYSFDLLGRQTQDAVTTLGAGVDGTVRRIGRSYEVRGLPQNITSYTSPTVGLGTVVNDVQRVYNTFGQATAEYQEHAGAVNTSTSVKVQYAYASGSANTIRPTSLTYPNGRALNFSYGASGGLDDALSRIASLIDNDGVTHLADYTRLGLGAVVQLNYAQPQIGYSLINGAGADPYTGLDQFNRVVDCRWYATATNTDVERVQHGYDRASDRLWRQNPVANANGVNLDELYSYDGLDRLGQLQRGALNGTQTAITAGTKDFAQAWGLDATGNWKTFLEDDTGSGSWSLNQSRTANAVNEITGITGGAWVAPAYDAAGNMTSMPQPASPTSSYTAVYDAWNRLVSLTAGATTVGQYAYDGANRRATKLISGTTRHFYYSAAWQVLEERLGTSTTPDRQFVWGLRYIDDLVLRDRGAERFYGIQDPNWNLTAICDTTGTIQERYAYAAYGVPTVLTGGFVGRVVSSYDWETRYGSYRWDGETGTYGVRRRWLHPVLGVWSARDALSALSAPYKAYRYGGANPMTFLDPLGLEELIINVVPVDEEEADNSYGPINPSKGNWVNPIWLSGLISRDELEPTSAQDMVSSVQSRVGSNIDPTGKCGNCIRVLYIRSHGWDGTFNIGKTSNAAGGYTTNTVDTAQLDPTNPGYNATLVGTLNQLIPLFCNEGQIILWTCRTGRDQRFLQLLADATGATVQGTEETTDWAIAGLSKWNTRKPGAPLPRPMAAPTCSKKVAKIKKGGKKVGKDKGKNKCKK